MCSTAGHAWDRVTGVVRAENPNRKPYPTARSYHKRLWSGRIWGWPAKLALGPLAPDSDEPGRGQWLNVEFPQSVSYNLVHGIHDGQAHLVRQLADVQPIELPDGDVVVRRPAATSSTVELVVG